MLPETRVPEVRDSCYGMGLPVCTFTQLFSKAKKGCFCNRMHICRSRSSKIVDFGTNRKGVCDFLLVISSNFGPILHRFWDTATYWLKIFPTPLSKKSTFYICLIRAARACPLRRLANVGLRRLQRGRYFSGRSDWCCSSEDMPRMCLCLVSVFRHRTVRF